MTRSRNVIVATGLLAFAAAGLSFPFYMASSKRPVIDPSRSLPPQATFRGPYINTGSRDVGPDHQTVIVLQTSTFAVTPSMCSTLHAVEIVG
ncbi:hypothetical protein TIFTF001_028871 [Ficus carica]|uniref:Uncharacterized protein n=1 Tax=Ficus carica TaxID=3494 RepID=A0AA88J243_FICCA|nr:hypothetical protein TIFTF001_028871 [Ficus carica]